MSASGAVAAGIPLLRPWGVPVPQLLLKPKFSSVEKIKTIGSTYMAAAGLSSPSGTENQVRSGAGGLTSQPHSRDIQQVSALSPDLEETPPPALSWGGAEGLRAQPGGGASCHTTPGGGGKSGQGIP